MEVFLMILQTIISIVIPVAISVLTYFAKKYVDEKLIMSN